MYMYIYYIYLGIYFQFLHSENILEYLHGLVLRLEVRRNVDARKLGAKRSLHNHIKFAIDLRVGRSFRA